RRGHAEGVTSTDEQISGEAHVHRRGCRSPATIPNPHTRGKTMSDRILYYAADSGRGVIGTIDSGNRLADAHVIPDGSFATDWTTICEPFCDRILSYDADSGRGVIGTIGSGNRLADAHVIPAGSFAKDWTQTTFLGLPTS